MGTQAATTPHLLDLLHKAGLVIAVLRLTATLLPAPKPEFAKGPKP